MLILGKVASFVFDAAAAPAKVIAGGQDFFLLRTCQHFKDSFDQFHISSSPKIALISPEAAAAGFRPGLADDYGLAVQVALVKLLNGIGGFLF